VVAVPAASAKHQTSALVWGVTLDNDGGIGKRQLADQVDALASLPLRPMTRVVIDYGATVADYAAAIPAIHGVSGVMAQLADSSEVKHTSAAAYGRWVQKFVDAYTISYYPSDCNGYWPSASTWQSVFDRLHARFPAAKLAFGEAGQSENSLTPEQNVALLQRYAAVQIAGDKFVGGYFWWYRAENAVPKGGAFWLGYAAAMH
jgi:hypothetical protein